MKVKSVDLDPQRVKAGPEDGLKDGEFIVYPSTFTREPDAYGDVIAKGAFLDDITAWKDSGNTLPGLYGHRMDDPDYFVAGAIDEGEDEHGWWVKGEFDLENPKAKQVYRLVKGRRLNQLSFAYDVLDEGKVELGDGKTANELRKLKRYEFSFVPVGANQSTSVVAVKALADSIRDSQNITDASKTALRDARDAIDSVITSMDNGKSTDPGGEHDQEKQASEDSAAKPSANDEASNGKSPASGEEPKRRSSVSTLAAITNTYVAAYGSTERGSS